MEGKFKIKFESREDFLKGSADFMRLLSTWKEKEEKYARSYDLKSDTDNGWNLEVTLTVDKRTN